MRKIFIMLFIAFAAITNISAQRKQQANTPTNVIKTFEYICDVYGQKNSQVYSVNKNPNTGIIESKEVITPFVCKKTEPHLTMIADDFHKDEPVSYQLMHIANGNPDNFFRVSVATGNTLKSVNIRTRTNQEMWYMAVKNPENPQLRDVYAIVWENKGDSENVEGMIYMITSLRMDIFEKEMEGHEHDAVVVDSLVADTLAVWTKEDEMHQAEMSDDPMDKLNTPQQFEIACKGQAVDRTFELIKSLFENMKEDYNRMKDNSVQENIQKQKSLDNCFEVLMKLDTQYDKQIMDVINTAKSYGIPQIEFIEIYKKTLKDYNDQSRFFNECYKHDGYLSKKATMCQKHINKLMEKYMDEIKKLL